MTLARGDDKSHHGSDDNDVSYAGIDWDVVLRTGNRTNDRLVGLATMPTQAKRNNQQDSIERRDLAKQEREAAEGWKSKARRQLTGSRRGESEAMGIPAAGMMFYTALPAITYEDRGNTRFGLTKLAFALAEYRARHGSTGETRDLVPRTSPRSPGHFQRRRIALKPEGDGYLLYSVGPNGKDDGGRNQNDNPDDKNLADCDDIAVRIPAKSK